MTQKERIKIELSKKGLHAEKLDKRDGIWIFKKTYFFDHGMSASETAAKILEALPKAEVLSVYDRWNCFPARSSVEVKFKMEEI